MQRVDGWAQGWRLPEGDAGEVVIRYAPERPYIGFLFGGLAIAFLVLIAGLVMMVRTRLGPEQQPWEARLPERPRGRVRRALSLPAVPAAAWVFGGVPALAGLALSYVFVVLGRRRPALWLAAALLLAGPVWVGLAIQLDRGPDQPWADVLAGAGFALAVGSTFIRSPRGPEPQGA